MAIHHVAIKATDPERVAAFYRDVLGLREVARHPMADAADVVRSVWLACGDAVLMVERSGRAGPPAAAFAEDPAGLHLVALRIDPSEAPAWRVRLASAGHRVVHETPSTLYALDPEGNRVGLSWYR
jgi:catechol 2,3-dioxygenase-like lactoylglutathione lyase family enzyme